MHATSDTYPATPLPTDDAILEAGRHISRRCFGHEGGGVLARDIGSDLYDHTQPVVYSQPELIRFRSHVARRLAALDKQGRAKKGGQPGRPFFRVADFIPRCAS